MDRKMSEARNRTSGEAGKPRLSLAPACLSLLFACALCLPTANGAERAEDATYLYELGQYARTASGLEKQFLSLIESAAGDERFGLYWTYNHLTGAWVQVGLLQSQLELSISVPPSLDEGMARTTLRDQAEFVVSELDSAIADLEQNVPEVKRSTHLRVSEGLLSLLLALRTTVNRLADG
jgi:hypothetical protein